MQSLTRRVHGVHLLDYCFDTEHSRNTPLDSTPSTRAVGDRCGASLQQVLLVAFYSLSTRRLLCRFVYVHKLWAVFFLVFFVFSIRPHLVAVAVLLLYEYAVLSLLSSKLKLPGVRGQEISYLSSGKRLLLHTYVRVQGRVIHTKAWQSVKAKNMAKSSSVAVFCVKG